jgi:protoporphyrin/coproporphyrin ferrochelatase
MPEKTAVLLLQMGGPDSLDAVEPFLCNLFSDRDIIRIGPAFLQPVIARIISRRRARTVVEYYRRMGGKSPLRELTEQQGAELEKVLGEGYRCFVAMRYWKPDTIEALAAIKREGISRIVALSLYPHYSRATSGSSFNELERVLAQSKAHFDLAYIRQFYDHPAYIGALVEKIEQGLAEFADRSAVRLVFSAHGLPQSFIDSGDPYLEHIQGTVRLVMEHFGGISHHLAFQSRAGPVKWLEPSTEGKITELAAAGCKDLLMVPLSFVSDHIETLYEIDIQYREEAQKLGIANFRRSGSLNSSPAFIGCLADLVHSLGF